MGNSRSVELTAAVAAAQEGVSFLFHSGCTVSRMVAMERELAEVWELSFVVPSDHESSEFKFVLKLMDDNEIPIIIEEGSNRVLKARKMLGGPGGSHIAKFELPKGFGFQFWS